MAGAILFPPGRQPTMSRSLDISPGAGPYDDGMTRNLDVADESPIELRRRRVFRVRIWSAVGCYVLASLALAQWGRAANPWRAVWAVLPLLVLAWIAGLVILRVRQMDEYQVKLLVPGLAVGFTVTIFGALTIGTLSSAGLTVPGAGWPVAIVGLVAWEMTNRIVKAPTA